MNEKRLENTAYILHAVMYSLISSLDEGSWRRTLFNASRYLPRILEVYGFSVDKEKSVEDNVKNLMDLLEKEGLVSDMKIEKIGENEFEIVVGECKLTDFNTHEALKPENTSCPYQIVFASIIHEHTEMDVVIESTEFLERGSRATLKILPYKVD